MLLHVRGGQVLTAQHASACGSHRQRVQELVGDVEGGAVGRDLVQRAVPADLRRRPRPEASMPIGPGRSDAGALSSVACPTLHPDSALTAVAGPAAGGGVPSQRSARHWCSRSRPLTCGGSALWEPDQQACRGAVELLLHCKSTAVGGRAAKWACAPRRGPPRQRRQRRAGWTCRAAGPP